jgi:hypothetical protein
VSVQAAHEFSVLSAVWNGLRSIGASTYHVPRPLLVLPENGLLFMEQAEGEPIARLLRRWVCGLHSVRGVSRRLISCGEWLGAFSSLGPRIAWPVVTPEARMILEDGRARHHVYRLIGLRGNALVQTVSEGGVRRLTAWQVNSGMIRRIEAAFSRQFRNFDPIHDGQGPVHGKFSIADVLIRDRHVSAVDLEQASHGSLYLDPAFFLSQVYMVTRWRPFSGRAPIMKMRRSFLEARSPLGDLDEALLDCFIAYYLINSLRPGGGIAGRGARSYAYGWLTHWVQRVGA